jgi:hypothetical protein
MWKNVEKCGKMWKNVEKCGKMWKNVEKCGKNKIRSNIDTNIQQ